MVYRGKGDLLGYFEVTNHDELMRYILKYPSSSKVQELMEFIELVERENERDKFV